MPSIAEDVKSSRTRLTFGRDIASAVFSSCFSRTNDKWQGAADAVIQVMEITEKGIGEGSRALLRAADEYDEADARAANEFNGVLRLFEKE